MEPLALVPPGSAKPRPAVGGTSRLAARSATWLDEGVIGAVVIVIVLVLIPVAVIMTGAIGAAILGHYVRDDIATEYADTEYIELGK